MYFAKPLGFLALSATIAGCATHDHHAQARQGPPYNLVPSVAIVQNKIKDPFTPPPALLAYNVLPASDTDVYIPRYPREAYRPTPLFGYSAYTTYTFDAQPIGSRHSGSYRYRWQWETAISDIPLGQ